MNKAEAEKLYTEGKNYIDRKVKLHKLDHKGKEEEKIFILKDIYNFCFETVVRNVGEKAEPENMFYDPKAILEAKNGKEKIEVIPLKEVLNAIKNKSTIKYNKWF